MLHESTGQNIHGGIMKKPMTEKNILVTGSTDGLGKLVAVRLAEKGATVLLHGRNKNKGKEVTDEIRRKTGNEKLKYYNADYASLKEVAALSDRLKDDLRRIDILINNVGIGTGKGHKNERELSTDGIELRFAVNYLSHVLLTERILDLLSTEEASVINVASVGQEPVDFSDMMLENHYDGYLAYKQSKAALVMYTFDLAARLKQTNTKINVLHPATLMRTKMVMEDWGRSFTTVEEGAAAVENLLDPPGSGKYYEGKQEARAIPQTYNQEARKKLWDVTRDLLSDYLE